MRTILGGVGCLGAVYLVMSVLATFYGLWGAGGFIVGLIVTPVAVFLLPAIVWLAGGQFPIVYTLVLGVTILCGVLRQVR